LDTVSGVYSLPSWHSTHAIHRVLCSLWTFSERCSACSGATLARIDRTDPSMCKYGRKSSRPQVGTYISYIVTSN
jgi:hypothetical protein